MDQPGAAPQSQTGSRVIAGASLSVLSNIVTHSLAIVSVAILGRLLEPQDFGIIALALIFTGISDALMNRQFDLALVRRTEIDASYYNTVFALSVGWGLFAAISLFLLAGSAASWFDEPALEPVLRVLCLLPLMDGLRNPYFVDFERRLHFLPIVGVHVGSKLAQATIGVILALLLGNHWALAGGLLGLALMRLLPTWILVRARPRPQLVHWRYFLTFGGWLSGTGLLGFVMQKADTALVSRFLGTTMTGLYNMGAELAMMATHHLSGQLIRIVYPGLSTMAGDPVRMVRAYHIAQELMLGFMLPLGVGVALVAPEAITLFVGEKWLPATPVLQALGPVLAISSLTYNVQAIIMVDGATRIMFLRNLVVACVQVPLIVVGLIYYGFVGAVAARVAATLLHSYLSLRIAGRMTGAPWWRALLVAWRSFAATLAMILAVTLTGQLLPAATGPGGTLLVLAGKAGVGGLTYGVVHILTWFMAGRPDGFERRIATLTGRATAAIRARIRAG